MTVGRNGGCKDSDPLWDHKLGVNVELDLAVGVHAARRLSVTLLTPFGPLLAAQLLTGRTVK